MKFIAILLTLVFGFQANAGLVEDFAFLVLVEEEQSKTTQGVRWYSYQEQSKLGWPNGGIVFVGSLNCIHCETVKENVFTSSKVIPEMNKWVCVQSPPKHWRLLAANRYSPPFLVSIKKGGDIVARIQCPTTVQSFLKVFPKKKEERK